MSRAGATGPMTRLPVTSAAMPLGQQPVWCAIAWIMIALLATWSYGTNNVALPRVPVPLVDVVLVGLMARSMSWWRPMTASGPLRSLLVVIVTLSVIVAARLVVDVPERGLDALRGAVFAWEIWAVFVGAAVARRVGRATVTRSLSWVFGLSLAWMLTYPIERAVMSFSPMVGVQRPVPLFSYATMGTVAAWALLWFGMKRTTAGFFGAAVALAAMALAQSRGSIAGVAVALVVMALASQHSSWQRLARRLVVGALVVTVIVAILPPLPGRLGVVSPDVLVDTVRTAFGGPGVVSTSFETRQDWNRETFEAIRSQPAGWWFGVGFGADLTGGFSTGQVVVINPHNDFLEFYARLGVGVIPWVAAWVITFRAFWRRSRTGDPLATWGLAAAVVMLLGSLTQPLNSFAYGGMLWWLLAGLVLGTDAPSRVRGEGVARADVSA